MGATDPDLSSTEALEAELAASRTRMREDLAFTLALHREPALRAAVAGEPAPHSYELALGPSGPCLRVEGAKLVGAVIAGTPSGDRARFDVYSALDPVNGVASTYRPRLRAAYQEANRCFLAIEHDAEGLTAADYQRLDRWAEVVAIDAYRQTTIIQMIFDAQRRQLIDRGEPEALRTYWMRVHEHSHLTVLAASAEPTTWLSEMARSFTWKTWTPSFPLVRERILRLAVRGAWASAKFGLPVVASYLTNILDTPLLRAFDAVLGLVSIASAHAADRAAIANELFARLAARDRAATGSEERSAVMSLERSARAALEAPAEAIRRLLGASRGAESEALLAEAMDRNDDPAEADGDGIYPCIVAMARLVHAPADALFRRRALAHPRWRPTHALETLRRTSLAPAN